MNSDGYTHVAMVRIAFCKTQTVIIQLDIDFCEQRGPKSYYIFCL